MAEGEAMEHQTNYIVAPIIFLLVVAFQTVSRLLERLKNGSRNVTEKELRAEIKRLLKEASSLSQPSTFAQSAKLRRLAAAKEKELAKWQEQHSQDIKLSYDLCIKVLFISKVVVYLFLVFWFWRAPIAAVSGRLVQPFGRLLSWGAGRPQNGNVMVGVIPWLILSTRVGKYICRLIKC